MNIKSVLIIFCILCVSNLVPNVLCKRSQAYNFEVVDDDDEFGVDSVGDNNENRGKGGKYQRLTNKGGNGGYDDTPDNKSPDRIKGRPNREKYEPNLDRILRLIRKNSYENENKLNGNSKYKYRGYGDFGSYGQLFDDYMLQ